jgi:hypothetical protein
VRTCEAQSACTTGLAIGCTAATCPKGAVCCAAIQQTPNGVAGNTTCMTTCPSNDFQLCTATTDCAAGETCVRIGGGIGGGTGILACIGRPDAGGFRDGGRPPPPVDAGGG